MINIRWPGWLYLFAGPDWRMDRSYAIYLSLIPRRDLMRRTEEGCIVVAALRLEVRFTKGRWPRVSCQSDANAIAERIVERSQGRGDFLVDYERNVLGVTVQG